MVKAIVQEQSPPMIESTLVTLGYMIAKTTVNVMKQKVQIQFLKMVKKDFTYAF